MSERILVGLNPSLPWPLAQWAWWTEPVRAERLAAVRIGIGAVLLLDILGFYYPHATTFFGRDSLAAPGVFQGQRQAFNLPALPWSALAGIESPGVWQGILLLWAAAALLLTVGVWPRRAAAVAWFIGGAVYYVNPFVYNGGDSVRNIILFYLMLSPCGAVWTPFHRGAAPVYVPAWPLRLLFVQMLAIYFCNGVAKLGEQWCGGDAIYYVMGGIAWARWSRLDLPLWTMQALSWITLAWELTFPVAVMWPRTRMLTLGLGVFFHIGTGLALKLGPFPFYMLCLYLPLLPWERWVKSEGATMPEKGAVLPGESGGP